MSAMLEIVDDTPEAVRRIAQQRAGQVIAGRYRLGRLLGWGGMGVVFEAEHVTIRRPLAVKLLHAQLGDERDAAARFEREAMTAGRLEHPNCVAVTDFGQLDDGTLYLVMERLTGRSLGSVIEESGRLPPARALHILRQILRGLTHAHALGVVHRDIKPDNVFLVERDGDRDFVKLLDFGIAKLFGDAAQGTDKLTQTGTAVGTPSYLAPEQVLGGAIDGRADLYSATVLLYEMLSGRTPFHGDPVAIVKQHLSAEPPPLAVVAPDAPVSPYLAGVVSRGLSKDPAARPASAEELLAALDRCPEAVGRRSAPADRARAPAAAPRGPVDVRPFLRRRWKQLLVGVGLFLVAAAALSSLAGPAEQPADRALCQMVGAAGCGGASGPARGQR